MEPIGFSEWPDVGHERNRGIKKDFIVLNWPSASKELSLTKIWMIIDESYLARNCGGKISLDKIEIYLVADAYSKDDIK